MSGGPGTPGEGGDRTARHRRMNRSRVVVAAASAGAFVVLTAGVAVANPGTDGSTRHQQSFRDDTARQAPSSDGGSADSGWWQPDDRGGTSSDPGVAPDPGASGGGWQGPASGFDPRTGGGSGNTRSGGS